MTSSLPNPNRPLAGILWMLAAGLMFVAMNAMVKHVGQNLPSTQAAFLRFLFGLIFVAPALGQIARTRFDRRIWALFLGRAVVHTVAVLCWFYAMTQITVAEVTAMNYLNPIYVMLGAALFLGESFSWRRMTAAAVAFLGVIVILRPGLRELGSGHLAMIFAAIGLGGSYLIAKRLSSVTSAAVVVAMMSLTVTVALAPFAWMVWVPPTGGQLAWLVAVAGVATGGHYAMSRAFAEAPVSVTQPVAFTQIVWAVIMGYVLFDEAVDGWVIAGALLIMGAVSYITWREAVLKRRAATVDKAVQA